MATSHHLPEVASRRHSLKSWVRVTLGVGVETLVTSASHKVQESACVPTEGAQDLV